MGRPPDGNDVVHRDIRLTRVKGCTSIALQVLTGSSSAYTTSSAARAARVSRKEWGVHIVDLVVLGVIVLFQDVSG
jgi:uncharacterized protein YceK